MYVRYKGGGQYVCNHLRFNKGSPACQYIRAARVDAVVADAFLTALAPAELDALSRAATPTEKAARARYHLCRATCPREAAGCAALNTSPQ